jgi:hypothetical protein
MIAHEARRSSALRIFGVFNATATVLFDARVRTTSWRTDEKG